MAHKLSAEEKKWRAQGDANILVSADEVRKDLARLRAALAELDRMNKVREKELKARKKLVKNSKHKKK
ncbi:MAG: hypothetical protein ACXADW_13175 [Candidatus Hodarchaeales archaeon]|jgi:hypothetical protein